MDQQNVAGISTWWNIPSQQEVSVDTDCNRVNLKYIMLSKNKKLDAKSHIFYDSMYMKHSEEAEDRQEVRVCQELQGEENEYESSFGVMRIFWN